MGFVKSQKPNSKIYVMQLRTIVLQLQETKIDQISYIVKFSKLSCKNSIGYELFLPWTDDPIEWQCAVLAIMHERYSIFISRRSKLF